MRTKESGAVVEDRFVGPFADRYQYDFKHCKSADGWKQYDTQQDASYFGVWVHPETRVIVTFAEGDETTVTCPTQEAFEAEIREMNEFYGSPPPACVAIGMDGSVTEYYDSDAAFGREVG